MDAYKRLVDSFAEKGYTEGSDKFNCPHLKSDLPIAKVPEDLRFEYLKRHLSGVHSDYVEYVKARPEQFDKQFFKDTIAQNYYSLYSCSGQNIFEWMADEFIDEELVMCAMIASVAMRYIDRRDECDDWFYSVQRRKPELLSQDMYILGARCFASKRNGENEFLEITPVEYRTEEYYHALCVHNDTPVMEDIPAEVLTNEFLINVLRDDLDSIKCFTEAALETEVFFGTLPIKMWQLVVAASGSRIRLIPLNEERIKFFLSRYDKDSTEYELGFKDHYKRYLKKLEKPTPIQEETKLAVETTVALAVAGCDRSGAIDAGSAVEKMATNRKTVLPIKYKERVPKAFAKALDREEYLAAIYKQLGIQILGEASGDYYSVALPEGLTIEGDRLGYSLKNSEGKTLLHYYDRGSFYDKTVVVDAINVELAADTAV